MDTRCARSLAVVLALLVGSAAAPSCVGPLDIIGVDSTTIEEHHNLAEPQDDRIADKHPEYDPARTVEETFGPAECRAVLNKSASVAKLDVVPLAGDDQPLADRVFHGRAEAVEFLAGREGAQRGKVTLIPSMEVVNGALKPFDDGLYAALELGLQQGVESAGTSLVPSKRQFLRDLLAAVLALETGATPAQTAHIESAAADLGAALLLGGDDPGLSPALRTEADARMAAFDADPVVSRPIGFYTWLPELRQVWRQDRFLQNHQIVRPTVGDPLSDAELGKATALALALAADAELLDRYQGYLAVYAGLTNPLADLPVTVLLPSLHGLATLDELGTVRAALSAEHPDVASPPCGPHLAVFPTSRSKETTYYESRWCSTGVPQDVDIMGELIAAIRDGLIDLAPAADSGWYDYQSYALETLLLPERGAEAQHLLLTAAYKNKLLDTFRSIATQHRETHVRQLDMGQSTGAAELPFDVYPKYRVEPFPTFYLRTARAYRFLAAYLAGVLGPELLGAVARLREDGTRQGMPLADELREKAELLYGLHLLAADATGMPRELLPDELAEYGDAACRATAEVWLAGWRTDEDVLRDPRVIVPVQADGLAHEIIYWATVGVRALRVRAEFVAGYEPRDVAPLVYPMGSPCTFGGFVPHEYYLMVETFAEVRLPDDVPPPTREELRAIGDAHDDVAGIVAELEAL